MNPSKATMYEACLMHSRAERILKSHVSKHLEKYNITRMEWLLLATVNLSPLVREGHTMGELAHALDIRLSQVTALVSNMHEASLLSQKVAKHDKRTRHVTITKRGSKLLANAEKSMQQAMRKWLQDIPQSKLTVYLETVEKLGYET